MRKLEKIMFFSDSPSDLLPEDYKGMPYRINSSSVIYEDGRIVRETDIDRDEYYRYLVSCKEIPTTAMGTPEQWLEGFMEAFQNGYTHAIIMTISSTASSVAQSITIAMDLFLTEHTGGMVFEVIDSRQYSLAYGCLLLEAFQMNAQGRPFQEIVSFLRQNVLRAHAVMGAYSLECMRKSGRISGMSAFVGAALGIRPILLARDGHIAPIDKVRGEKNLIPRMVDHIKEYIRNPEEQEIWLVYGLVPPEEVDRMENLLMEVVRPKCVRRHNIGVTVVTNSGPECVFVAFSGDPYDDKK